MDETEKERIKYYATLLNTCAAACFTIGVVGPGAAAAYGTPTHIGLWLFVLVAAGWLLVAASLTLGRQICPGAASMTDLQIFAFIVLPIVVAALGWLAAFAVVRSAKSDKPPLPGTPRHHP